MPEAYERWAALQEEHSQAGGKTRLYTKTGGLFWGPAGFARGEAETCDKLGVVYEVLSSAAVGWPPLVPTEGWEGLFNPDCGVLHADACVAALQAKAAVAGAVLHEHCTVASIEGGG